MREQHLKLCQPGVAMSPLLKGRLDSSIVLERGRLLECVVHGGRRRPTARLFQLPLKIGARALRGANLVHQLALTLGRGAQHALLALGQEAGVVLHVVGAVLGQFRAEHARRAALVGKDAAHGRARAHVFVREQLLAGDSLPAAERAGHRHHWANGEVVDRTVRAD